METRKYELLLAAVIGARATSFMFNKMLLEGMGTFTLLAIRFLIAFGVLQEEVGGLRVAGLVLILCIMLPYLKKPSKAS